MFDNTFKKLLSVLLLMSFIVAVLFAIPKWVVAGNNNASPNTDVADSELVGYWDLRDRESFFQLTNVGGAPITVHVQLHNASTPGFTDRCVEFDFFDTYTGNDTHIYNIRELTRNNGLALAAPILTDGHGLIVVTIQDGTSCGSNDVLIGQHRIIDILGDYEYRTNALGMSEADDDRSRFGFNFSDVNGTAFSDIIPVAMSFDEQDDICRGVVKPKNVRRAVIDLNENPISCLTNILGCQRRPITIEEEINADIDPVLVNLGINQRIPNSRDGAILCQGTDANGWVAIRYTELGTPNNSGCDDNACGGFVGLNNGDGTGSMDAWVGLDDDFQLLGD